MENKKVWIKHLIIRILWLPLVIGVIYLILWVLNLELSPRVTKFRLALFGGSAITALTLMGEAIRLFGKRKTNKVICNVSVVFFIIFFLLFTLQNA